MPLISTKSKSTIELYRRLLDGHKKKLSRANIRIGKMRAEQADNVKVHDFFDEHLNARLMRALDRKEKTLEMIEVYEGLLK